MSLLIVPEMSPPRCRRRGNRDGDKLLCNIWYSLGPEGWVGGLLDPAEVKQQKILIEGKDL